ncbi:hypothetical protein C8R43DRAFT_322210 [Mycena crocata]|nr:hypothetical protein C8R43DRAFT_322210 [Mycena crocata]
MRCHSPSAARFQLSAESLSAVIYRVPQTHQHRCRVRVFEPVHILRSLCASAAPWSKVHPAHRDLSLLEPRFPSIRIQWPAVFRADSGPSLSTVQVSSSPRASPCRCPCDRWADFSRTIPLSARWVRCTSPGRLNFALAIANVICDIHGRSFASRLSTRAPCIRLANDWTSRTMSNLDPRRPRHRDAGFGAAAALHLSAGSGPVGSALQLEPQQDGTDGARWPAVWCFLVHLLPCRLVSAPSPFFASMVSRSTYVSRRSFRTRRSFF